MENTTYEINATIKPEVYKETLRLFKSNRPLSEANIKYSAENNELKITNATGDDVLYFGIFLGRAMHIQGYNKVKE